MEEVDRNLMARAEPHFLDAFASFGKPSDDLVRIAQEISKQEKWGDSLIVADARCLNIFMRLSKS